MSELTGLEFSPLGGGGGGGTQWELSILSFVFHGEVSQVTPPPLADLIGVYLPTSFEENIFYFKLCHP
jgi:hypothetical protein